ncbi:hypothetical protein F3Y22_tig00016004pilonHSYRG00133 [Hibiscus syriacus]|uniref:Uncharacterized protein n=1 Tax=Hibiscus syriacus TaxID=106335 RepID=A0A6A3C035_HIBSY|nr:hypothetical protein F3Y22_tig00016004pilonHSYRG00133 [Hibiscus syriacus]
MEPQTPSQPRRPGGFAATVAAAATSVSPTSTLSGSAQLLLPTPTRKMREGERKGEDKASETAHESLHQPYASRIEAIRKRFEALGEAFRRKPPTTKAATIQSSEATIQSSEATIQSSEATIQSSEATIQSSEATIQSILDFSKMMGEEEVLAIDVDDDDDEDEWRSYKITVSLAKYKHRQSYWKKLSTIVQRKSEMEDVSRNKHCKVEGVVDEDKLHVLSNCLVGWCKNFIKIGNLDNQMQAKGLAGFTLMRADGNVVLMVFEDSDSLRSVKDDKLETLAKWFSRVETWSESLVVEYSRVWLVCEGVPFHAWNWDTFKNIAAKWGILLAIDNSCEFPSTFDRAKIQILTKAQVRIDELLELKVDANLFKIMVHEVDPSNKILGSLKIVIFH